MVAFPHVLIGEVIEVVQSQNRHILGLKGKVIDETKKTIVVRKGEKRKVLLKSSLTLRLQRNGQLIPGRSILRRPEERMKS